MKHSKLLLAVIALLVAGSPMLVQGASHVFTHPTSLPKQASDNARKALADRGTHGNETGEHDDHESTTGAAHEHNDTKTEHDETGSTDVDNTHSGTPDDSMTNSHCIMNDNVVVQALVKVTPGLGATVSHSITHLPLSMAQVSNVIAVEEGC